MISLKLDTFEEEFGVISFEVGTFDKVLTDPDARDRVTKMCNLVKYNTEIQRTLCDLVDEGILTSTTEDGKPADMSELKEAVANNDTVLAYLVAKYGLVLWTDDEITEEMNTAVKANGI